MPNIKIFSRKAYSSFKFRSIIMQLMTNMYSTKHNNKELVRKLSIYPNLQLILIQSLSMHTNNKNIYGC
jgi:hypothetical protein